MPISDLLNAAQIGCKTTSDAGLARCLRVSRQAVSSWRRGETFPDWAACQRIATVTGIALPSILENVATARLRRPKRFIRGMVPSNV